MTGDWPTSGVPTAGCRTAPLKLDLPEQHMELFVSTRSMPCRENKPTVFGNKEIEHIFQSLAYYTSASWKKQAMSILTNILKVVPTQADGAHK